MIPLLIKKDFLTIKKLFALHLFGWMLVGGLLHIKYFAWHVYMMYGYLLITSAASFYVFFDFKSNARLFILSLPVSRNQVIISKYIFSALIFIVGIFMWFLNAYFFDTIYEYSNTTFDQILHIKVLFMAAFFYIVQQSIFLPSYFKFNSVGTNIMAVLSIIIAILTIPLLFYPYKRHYINEFVLDDITFVTVLTIIMVLMAVLSLLISLKVFNNRDL